MQEKDRQRLRTLASRTAELAAAPRNQELKTLWRKHNAMQGVRPMLTVETGSLPPIFCRPCCNAKTSAPEVWSSNCWNGW